MTKDVEHFLSVFQPFQIRLLRVLCVGLYPIFYWIICSLMTNFLNSLYILEFSTLSNVGLVKIFFHSIGCRFVLLTVSFALQKLLSFRRSHLLIVALSVVATGFLFRKWSSVPMHSSKCTSHFLFYEVQCSCLYVDIFDPFGLEFCAW